MPPTLRQLQVPRDVLEQTWTLLQEPGEQGLEGVVLWPGRVLDATTGQILAAYRPTQVAYRSELGVAVEIPQEALTELIAALPDGVHLLARVHTHPGVAYHSSVDDSNMVIGHVGAISVVVPHFAVGPATLESCSVNRLGADGRWVELDRDQARECLRIQ